MDDTDRRSPSDPPGVRRRVLRGYGPLVMAGVVFVVLVVVVPSTPSADEAVTADARVVEEARTATGWDTLVTPCPDRELQIPDDPYSPPCFAFQGDNGGATSPGVTADTINVSYRVSAEGNVFRILATLMGIPFDETSEDFVRTMEGLVEYVNANFQMYGREIVLKPYDGVGSLVEELTGGGVASANNDALRARTGLDAFADVTADTQPYAEALAEQSIVGFGAPYMSSAWFRDHRPYAWSLVPDCTRVAVQASEYALSRLIDRPAIYAGGELEGQTRRLATIAPNNAQYQKCTAAGLEVIRDAGEEVALVTDYVLDLGRIPSQAASIAAQLVSNDITTISCFCDPFMVLNLTQQIASIGLQPEWIVTGVGFIDFDLIGQGLAAANDQWTRAFGTSALAEQPPLTDGPGYRAFKSVRPDQEPSQLVNLLYYQLYQLALGVQMAGPTLTPATLETGLFSYPKNTGPAGTWDYLAGYYTPVIDLREVWWDPDAMSSFNGRPGSYASTGDRFPIDEIPDGQPEVFGR